MPKTSPRPVTKRRAGRWMLASAAVVGVSALLLSACPDPQSLGGAPAFAGDALLGGLATVRDTTPNAFGQPAPGLERDEALLFFVGNSFFKKNWVQAPSSTTARDGLGPLFNSRSCGGCHLKDGRGRPPVGDEVGTGFLVRLSLPGTNASGGPAAEPSYGNHLQDQAIQGAQAEGRLRLSYTELPGRFADGEAYSLRRPEVAFEGLTLGPLHPDVQTSPRIANQIIGMGLLEAVPESVLLERHDPEDADTDGISGRANRVWNHTTERLEFGRFGWKANQPTLRQQVASAFFDDMGIANDLFSHEDCAPFGPPSCVEGELDIDTEDLDKVVLYTAALAVPAQRTPQAPEALRGRELFYEVGCETCHREQMKTGPYNLEALSDQVIRPYSDLLLHDMGPGLADGRPDFLADGNEWRTPPLWGIGLIETVNGHTTLLHDGRARNILEAILWHGGEAEGSKDAFVELSKEDREAVLRFLESL
ncbi:MAG: di-heme oxidoredictase family protein [Acidobacteriota bacterium]